MVESINKVNIFEVLTFESVTEVERISLQCIVFGDHCYQGPVLFASGCRSLEAY